MRSNVGPFLQLGAFVIFAHVDVHEAFRRLGRIDMNVQVQFGQRLRAGQIDFADGGQHFLVVGWRPRRSEPGRDGASCAAPRAAQRRCMALAPIPRLGASLGRRHRNFRRVHRRAPRGLKCVCDRRRAGVGERTRRPAAARACDGRAMSSSARKSAPTRLTPSNTPSSDRPERQSAAPREVGTSISPGIDLPLPFDFRFLQCVENEGHGIS